MKLDRFYMKWNIKANVTIPLSRAYAVAASLLVLFSILCYSQGLVMFANYDKRGCDPMKTGINGNQVSFTDFSDQH